MADSQRGSGVQDDTVVVMLQDGDKPAHDSHPQLTAFILVFTSLLSILSIASALVFILLPHDISSIIVQSLAVLMTGVGVAVWWQLGTPCWKWLRWKWPVCSCLDMRHPPNLLDSTKLCCFAISFSGPAVIMVGSVAILWLEKSYEPAVALTIVLVLVASFVVYLNLLAIVQCCSATKHRIFATKGCPEIESLKTCLSWATKLSTGIFFVIFFLSMMFNMGITIIGLVTLGTVEEVWRCGLVFVPTGLLLFVVPFLAAAVALNCIVVLGCMGGCVRCSGHALVNWTHRGNEPLHNEGGRMENVENLENLGNANGGSAVDNTQGAVQTTPPAFAMETLR